MSPSHGSYYDDEWDCSLAITSVGREEANRAHPLPLDDVIARVTESRAETLLRGLAGRRLTRCKAREALPRVLEHKRLLTKRLGRDVGLRVAAVDYFDNFAA